MTTLDPLKRIGALTAVALLLAVTIVSSLFMVTSEAQAAWAGTVTTHPASAYPNQTVDFRVVFTADKAMTISKVSCEIDWGNSSSTFTLTGNMSLDARETTNLTGTFVTPDVAPGTYSGNVTITAKATGDLLSSSRSYDFELTIDEVPALKTTAQASPNAGSAPLDVTFTSTAVGGIPPYTYEWRTGDGSTASTSSFDHQYAEAGDYTATLTITDSRGVSATANVSVSATATTTEMVATIEATATNGLAPLTTTLSATVSGGKGPYTYSWTTGDGGTYSGESFTYEYNEPGTYTVRLVVTDQSGNTARDLVTIVVLTESNQTTAPVQIGPLDIGPVLIAYVFVFVAASVTVVGFMIYRNRTRFRR